MFNKEMNIVKALGIAVIVAGHLEFGIFGTLFPPYSFSLAIFFFVAGYFYKDEYEKNILQYIVKKAKTLLVPYFGYNLFYAGATWGVYKLNGNLMGSLPTLKNFFIQPFFNGCQCMFMWAMWFIPQLFFSLVTFLFSFMLLKKINQNKYFHLLSFLAVAILAIALQKYSGNGYALIAIRTMFSMFFIYFGYFYKRNIEGKDIFNTRWLMGIITLQSALWLTNKDFTPQDGIGLSYILIWGKFDDQIIPIITSLTGIWICLFIAKILVPMVKDGSFIDLVGKNTYHIMANHLFIFYLLTVGFLSINGISLDILNNKEIYWTYMPIKTMFFYFVVAMAGSTYIGIGLKFLKGKINGIITKNS